MNRRKAKKQVKRALGIRRWPGSLPPRLVKAIHQDLLEAMEEALDHAILYGDSAKPPRHYNRWMEALETGTKPREKYTAELYRDLPHRIPCPGDYIVDAIRGCVHAE